MNNRKHRECFVNGHCCYDCPSFDAQAADERYGYGIAEDMGLEEIECKDCHYNSGECKDCLLENSPDCPKYEKEVTTNAVDRCKSPERVYVQHLS